MSGVCWQHTTIGDTMATCRCRPLTTDRGPERCAPFISPGSPHLRGQHATPGHRGQPTGAVPAVDASDPNPYAAPQPTRCNVPANDHVVSARTLATVSSAG